MKHSTSLPKGEPNSVDGVKKSSKNAEETNTPWGLCPAIFSDRISSKICVADLFHDQKYTVQCHFVWNYSMYWLQTQK